MQGKANIEVKFEAALDKNGKEIFNFNKRLKVRVVECLELTLKNGTCDPYALVTVTYSNGKKSTKRTKVRKKTVNPQFEEVFIFENYDEREKDKDSTYTVCPESDVEICELNVSVWHDSPGMADNVFLGEVRIPIRGAQQQNAAASNAWYFLQPRSTKNRPSKSCSTPPGTRLSSDNSLGSLRLKIQYTADHVFSKDAYQPLCALLLQSIDITVSKLFLLI